MRIEAFNKAGGYDESFSHNEDAELDVRLARCGYKIWLTARTRLVYYPRSTPFTLFKQYLDYGQGRLHTMIKHKTRPKCRQFLPAAVLPAVLLAIFTPLCWIMASPLTAWAAVCLAYGASLGSTLSGVAAMVMHLGWSLGFWRGLVGYAHD